MDRKAIREFTHCASDFLNVGNENYKQWVFRYTFLELEKDLGLFGDISTKAMFSTDRRVKSEIIAKSDGVLAGRQEIEYFLRDAKSNFRPRVGGEFDLIFHIEDGGRFKRGDKIASLEALVFDLLAVERTILNLLMRMSGVATHTAKLCKIVSEEDVMLAATRKTLWGLLDKRAVVLGGGGSHRLNLSDSIIIKDTHLDQFDRDFDLVFEKLIAAEPEVRFVEIEVESLSEAVRVAEKFSYLVDEKQLRIVGVVMLDNFSSAEVSETVRTLKMKDSLYNNVLIEASGGIGEHNLLEYAETGVDIISTSALTMGVPSVDFSMKVVG